jgi:hypothetical protein
MVRSLNSNTAERLGNRRPWGVSGLSATSTHRGAADQANEAAKGHGHGSPHARADQGKPQQKRAFRGPSRGRLGHQPVGHRFRAALGQGGASAGHSADAAACRGGPGNFSAAARNGLRNRQ